MSVHKLCMHQCPQGIEEGFRSFGSGYRQLWTTWSGCWEPNFFLEEQEAFLTILPPPPPLTTISALPSLVFPALAVDGQVSWASSWCWFILPFWGRICFVIFYLFFFLKTGSSIASEVLHYKWTTLWGSWEAVASADTLFCSDVFLTWLFIIVVRYPLSGPGSPGEFWKVSMLLVIFLKDMLASPTCLVFILHWPCTAMKEN